MATITKYRVKDSALDEFPQLFTQVNGKRVTLHGKEEKVELAATARLPKRIVTVPMATETEIEQLYKEGHPFVEPYEEEVVEVKKADKTQ